MLVRNWMTSEVVTIDANAPMKQAIDLVKLNRINMLPVLKKGKLCGVLTDGDLRRASASDATTLDIHELRYLIDKIKVHEIMSKPPIFVSQDLTLEETAEMFAEHKISGVPVVEGKKLVGVITYADIARALISLSGYSKRGVQLAMLLEDHPGSIKDVTDIIRSSGARIRSILSAYEGAPKGYRKTYIRIYNLERNKLSQLLEQLRNQVRMLYMVDHRYDRRIFYQEGAPAPEIAA